MAPLSVCALPYTWERSGQELKLKSVYPVTSLIPEQAISMLKAAREMSVAFVAMINEADTISGKHHTDPQKLPGPSIQTCRQVIARLLHSAVGAI